MPGCLLAEDDDLYRGLAEGAVAPPIDEKKARPLLQRAWEAARSADPAERMRGLRVAAAFGAPDGLDVVLTYLDDADLTIRRYAYNLAVEAGDAGLNVVREASENPDEDLAVDAITLLRTRNDRQSTSLMRRLLDSPHARVREAAVRMLGEVAGVAVLMEVRRLLEDDDDTVREAARVAVARISGESPPAARPAPAVAPPAAPPAPPSDAGWAEGNEPPPASPALPPPPPATGALPNLAALRAATVTSQGTLSSVAPPARLADSPPRETAPPAELAAQPRAEAPAPPPSSRALPVPVVAEPGSSWAPEVPIPLPGTLPSEALALVRLLGRVAPGDRPLVLDALRRVDAGDMGAVVSGYQTGSDAARGCGAALAAQAMGSARWTTALRGYLADPDPGVRCTALHALAVLAGPSLLPRIAEGLRAKEPEVRACALWSLAHAAVRLGEPALARQHVGALDADPDPQVKAALAAAKRAVGTS